MFIIFQDANYIKILPMEECKIVMNSSEDVRIYHEKDVFHNVTVLNITNERTELLKYVMPAQWKKEADDQNKQKQPPQNHNFGMEYRD